MSYWMLVTPKLGNQPRRLMMENLEIVDTLQRLQMYVEVMIEEDNTNLNDVLDWIENELLSWEELNR